MRSAISGMEKISIDLVGDKYRLEIKAKDRQWVQMIEAGVQDPLIEFDVKTSWRSSELEHHRQLRLALASFFLSKNLTKLEMKWDLPNA